LHNSARNDKAGLESLGLLIGVWPGWAETLFKAGVSPVFLLNLAQRRLFQAGAACAKLAPKLKCSDNKWCLTHQGFVVK
jgi:hypothetical protein